MSQQLIIPSVICLVVGIIFFFFPEKFIKIPFIKSFGQKRTTAYFRGHEQAYGKEEGIKKIKQIGTIFLIAGVLLLVYSLLF